MPNILISKTSFVVTLLVWFKVSLVRSRPNLDPQGLPCLTCVQPNLTCPTHYPGIQSLDVSIKNQKLILKMFTSIFSRFDFAMSTAPDETSPVKSIITNSKAFKKLKKTFVDSVKKISEK